MKADKQYIIRMRRELHQIPEIGFDLFFVVSAHAFANDIQRAGTHRRVNGVDQGTKRAGGGVGGDLRRAEAGDHRKGNDSAELENAVFDGGGESHAKHTKHQARLNGENILFQRMGYIRSVV